MFMPTIPRRSHLTQQQVMLRKRMKKHKKLASQLRQAEQFRSAIEHYEIALNAVYELGADHPDHGEALKIRECIADVHSLLGQYEDALMMYSSVKDGYFKGVMDTTRSQRVKILEEKEALVMSEIKTSRDEKAKNRCNQLFQLGLVNIKLGNYQKARDLLVRVLNCLKMREGVISDQVLIVRMHLGDLHMLNFETEEAGSIYESILLTMAERKEGPNWEIYAEVRQRIGDLDGYFKKA